MEKKVKWKGNFLSIIKSNNWEYVKRNTSTGAVSSVLAITKNQNVIFVEQHRIPVGKSVIELPSGVIGDIDEKEKPLLSAQRELLEETGYSSEHWESIYVTPKSAGMTNELEYAFIADDCVKTGKGGGDKYENIIIHEVPITKVRSWLWKKEEEGMLISSGIYSAMYFIN